MSVRIFPLRLRQTTWLAAASKSLYSSAVASVPALEGASSVHKRRIATEPNPLNWRAYDAVVDVRTPAEFADDGLPGAVNLPLLSDVDRVAVGRKFAESPFAGRRLGAAMIARRIGGLLEEHFADKQLDYRPLIYCWRGGQRSHSLALVLSQIGYSPTVLAGGYRAYRRLVMSETQRLAESLTGRAVVLAGLTGSGKTFLLERLAERGEQVINLEALANHKGSMLGHDPLRPEQPTQKAFESALFARLSSLPPPDAAAAGPVWLECESTKIGRRHLPPSLIAALAAAPRILLEPAGDEDRVRHLTERYAQLAGHPAELKEALRLLAAKHHTQKTLDRWLDAAEAGDTAGLVRQLLRDHYDPLYRRSRAAYFTERNPLRVTRLRLAPGPDGLEGGEVLDRLLAAGERLLSSCGTAGCDGKLDDSQQLVLTSSG